MHAAETKFFWSTVLVDRVEPVSERLNIQVYYPLSLRPSFTMVWFDLISLFYRSSWSKRELSNELTNELSNRSWVTSWVTSCVTGVDELSKAIWLTTAEKNYRPTIHVTLDVTSNANVSITTTCCAVAHIRVRRTTVWLPYLWFPTLLNDYYAWNRSTSQSHVCGQFFILNRT